MAAAVSAAAAADLSPQPQPLCARAGDTAILQSSDDRRIFVDVGPGKIARVGRGPVALDPLVGAPYGTVFEVDRSTLVPVEGGLTPYADDGPVEGDMVADNRNLVDSQTAQSLTHQDIERMKAAGTSGREIIQSLVNNSETFESKTEFSQAKWLARKARKYRPRVRLERVTAHGLCTIYTERNALKCAGLRGDVLALLLSHANVSYGKSALVFDTLMGVVAAAVLERVGEAGWVLAPYHREAFNADAMKRFNFSEHLRFRTLVQFPTSEFGRLDEPEAEEPAAAALSKPPVAATSDPPAAASNGGPGADPNSADKGGSAHGASNGGITGADALALLDEGKSLGVPGGVIDPEGLDLALAAFRELLAAQGHPPEEIEKRAVKRRLRLERWQLRLTPRQTRDRLRHKADCLIIAAKCDPLSSLQALLPHLAPSGAFVVYCEFQEPMVECFKWAQTTEALINVQMCDTWYPAAVAVLTASRRPVCRVVQVLPGRTHPEMTLSSSCSGFFMSGIKVVPREDPRPSPPSDAGRKRRRPNGGKAGARDSDGGRASS
ncbi:Gcd10p family-domain-containing protein [Tribonema minus]|uniref:tRNA (adenine(58)-N(1))-methyltransferase non-catalytic subunit TRM6 n=1 Tax=Tribonema minus TaxID=303371 RepID=A0A836CEQ6_9STRA|nr:Gcd10p family-domain-containing protein [Tribonema minus]